MGDYVVITGNLADGIEVYGPFADEEDADAWIAADPLKTAGSQFAIALPIGEY